MVLIFCVLRSYMCVCHWHLGHFSPLCFSIVSASYLFVFRVCSNLDREAAIEVNGAKCPVFIITKAFSPFHISWGQRIRHHKSFFCVSYFLRTMCSSLQKLLQHFIFLDNSISVKYSCLHLTTVQCSSFHYLALNGSTVSQAVGQCKSLCGSTDKVSQTAR